MTKITVIGGSGFIGTNLCRRLNHLGKKFEIIDLKKSFEFPHLTKIADVRDIQSLRKNITGDVLVNLAAVHRDNVKNKFEYQETNVNGASNIVKVCFENGISRIVFTSTVAVYGFTEAITKENGVINPFNEYGKTKFEAETIFSKWGQKERNSLVIVRPTAVFGEGNRGNVYNLLNQIASGKFFMIGNGENKKSLAYVANLATFLIDCIFNENYIGVYNYTDTPDLTMNELVKIVRSKLHGKDDVGVRIPVWLGLCSGYFADFLSILIGKNLPISSVRVKKFLASTEFSSEKLKFNSFSPPFSLPEGLEFTLQNEFINPNPKREIFYTE